jgi:DUF971 family protein
MEQEWPSQITINKPGRTLDLVWDAADASVSHQALRAACRCTECESTRRKTGIALPVAPEVEISKVEPVGSVGLQFFFSDGHNRGIYPWPYLHEIAYRRNAVPVIV